jgi:hypothetical protein
VTHEHSTSLHDEDLRIIAKVKETCNDLLTGLDELNTYLTSLIYEITPPGDVPHYTQGEGRPVTLPLGNGIPPTVPSRSLSDRAEALTTSVQALHESVTSLQEHVATTEQVADNASLAVQRTRRTNTWLMVTMVLILLVTVVVIATVVTNRRLIDTLKEQQNLIDTRTQVLCKLTDTLAALPVIKDKSVLPQLQKQQAALNCK